MGFQEMWTTSFALTITKSGSGTFQMPAQASSLVINSGSDSEEGGQN